MAGPANGVHGRRLDKLTDAVDSLTVMLAKVSDKVDSTKDALEEDKAQMASVLRILRGDDQGKGGLATRLTLIEDRLDRVERDRERTRRQWWEVLGWVAAGGGAIALLNHFFQMPK